MISFATRTEADEAVSGKETVCATLLEDGTPRYFLMPADAADMAVRAAAFEVRNGREMMPFEETVLSLAESRAGA